MIIVKLIIHVMNAVEFIVSFFLGPVPHCHYYGQALWFVNFLLLWHSPITYSMPSIILGLIFLHVILNLYQTYTARLFTGTAHFEELAPEISKQISTIANQHGITIKKQQLVTNFPVINAFCARSKNNAEIYVSHHWFESEEATKHLMHILGHELGHAFYNDQVTRALFNSILYAATTATIFSIHALIPPTWIYTNLIALGLQIIGISTSLCLQAAYSRYTEFRADAFGAASSSPEEMKQALIFLENKNLTDKAFAHLPEWKHATHPKVSNRIMRLDAMERKS